MDTELARTFLTIVERGSFIEAARRLHLTQSTISARMQRLEQQLGVQLFTRHPGGSELTSAGRQFQRHASLLTRIVQQARQELGAAGHCSATLTIGGRIGLWEGLLSGWLADFAASQPQVAVRAFIGFENELMQALILGHADIAVMYVPQVRPGLQVELLFEERLALIGTAPQIPAVSGTHYVHVDWGPEFFAWHRRVYPEFTGAAVTVNTGQLGLQHVLARGGQGFFPLRLLRDPLYAGRLQRIAGAPEFRLPAYLCFASPARPRHVDAALEAIRATASAIGNFDS